MHVDMSRHHGLQRLLASVLTAGLLLAWGVSESQAQFESTWLDVGDYQSQYFETGAGNEGNIANNCKKWPAIFDIAYSDHCRSKALWIGVKNWTDENGDQHDFYVNRIGPRSPGVGRVFPTEHKLVSSLGDPNSPVESQPSVTVEGGQSFDQVTFVDEVRPDMAADRMLLTRANTLVGITMTRKVYAFSNDYHDDYHIIEYTYTNTGNTDEDEEIELEGQTLNDVYIYRSHRETGNEQAAWVTGNGQPWGEFNMIDVVGDGHKDYNVDYRAIYNWIGWRPEQTEFNNLGGPIWDDGPWYIQEGDSTGRLAGGSMTGRVTIYGEASGNEGEYDIDNFPPPQEMDADNVSEGTFDAPDERQPHILGYQDSDGRLTSQGEPMEDYYQLGILAAERERGGRWPHYANLVEPDGNFTTTQNDASSGRQGGFGGTVSYGPYDLEFGESVRIVVADAAGGLSWEARNEIGEVYKASGGQDSLHIQYDANGDGTIQGAENDAPGEAVSTDIPYDESLTKNQWVMSAKDSLFKNFDRAINNYWSGFDIPQAPAPPKSVSVVGRPDQVEISWTAYSGEEPAGGWEVYRTPTYVENLPYEKIADLDPSARSYADKTLQRGIDYYYFVQAVGGPQPEDPTAMNGTPDGEPLKSSRYYAQTFTPVQLKRPPGEELTDFRIVPNPFNLAMDEQIRWPGQENKLGFLELPGQATIRIYTEAGELVETIEHTDGSGDEFWNMTTDARQLLVSGMYIAVVTDHTRNDRQLIRKFAIIR